MEHNEIDKYQKFMLYRDSNTYMFENIVGTDQLSISINDHDIYVQYNNIKKRIPLKENQTRVFRDFVLGNYCVKYYYHDEKLLYSKFIWKNKDLKKFNFNVKIFFFQCRKINHVETIKGITWT